MINYIKKHRRGIVYGILCSILFGLNIYLFHIPMKITWYVILLWVLLGCIFLGFDYYSYRKKLKKLQRVQANILVSQIKDWPESECEMEGLYQQMIEKLQTAKAKMISEQEAWKSETKDYYTLWVHQVKTPIAAMRLMLQNMESGSERRELEDELFQMEQYVEMALSFMRLQSDTNDLVIGEYDLGTLVKNAVKKYSRQFIGKKIRLELDEFTETIITDEKWFGFVIEQVLSNALKYTKDGKIKIYCKKHQLCIEDTGIGIAPEDLPRICEKGYTGYNGRWDKKATGLGLYLCKQTMDKLGCTFLIESEVSVGTKVTFGFENKKKVIE